ncbi:hypothetical protein [Zobellella endophytica]|uniref:hypothetical protein n=1 Tax=Zobellella endophytica TaxID=2116700 RepID=UPI0011B24E1D|nr:hypothetical protein [Zobellella endophytica]
MRTLFLHIGHGKTGSSYIQSSIALSVGDLLKNNIVYPSINLDDAKKGFITSGNGGLLLSPQIFKILENSKGSDILFSSEMLFHHFIDNPNNYNVVNEFCEKEGISQVKILLYIRNPVSHAASDFQQSVKRGGNGNTIERFFEGYRMPANVRKFISDREKIKNSSLTIVNYSKERKALLTSFSGWLGIPESTLSTPAKKVVNRSLTYSELEFQRHLNKKLGISGDFIADPLCNLLPDVKSEVVLPSLESQKSMISRLSQDIEFVNLHAKSNGYDIDISIENTKRKTDLTFSQAQVEVLSQSIGNKILGLEQALTTLKKSLDKKEQLTTSESKAFFNSCHAKLSGSDNTANTYRELALMFEELGNIPVALQMMKVAKSFRPDGPLINNKIKVYETLLAQ